MSLSSKSSEVDVDTENKNNSAEDKNDTTPLEFICPLTRKIMADPVLMPDGVSYERTAIQTYLGKNGRSPKTGEVMENSGVANNALKSLIERYLHPDSGATAAAIGSLPKELDIGITAVYEGDNIHIQVKPNAAETRPETIIVAVVDTSGSMDGNAAQTIGGAENLEITRLQLVQFSMKTVVNALEPRDGLVLFRFDDVVREVLPYTTMDTAGKGRATTAIDGLSTSGCTNIWEAARVGAETALQLQKKHAQATIKVMLFTDGEPTSRPKRPEIELVKELLEGMADRRFTVSTFSYGYSIDSGLMDGIAGLGWGVYGYCPDASLVGTIFINYLAQAMNCLVQHMVVEINGCAIVRSLHIAHPLNFLIKGDPQKLQVTVRMPGKQYTLSKAAIKPAQTQVEKEALLGQLYRQKLISIVRDNLSDAAKGLAAAQALHKEIKALPAKTRTPLLDAIALDLIDADAAHGQVGKAFDAEFYRKWGKDYLRGFARFHENETCGNFKDESLQLYQTPQFGIRRRAINKMFMAMPPLVGRKRYSSYSSYSSSYSSSSSSYSSTSTVRQDDWYDRCGGCWDGDALVSMSGGTMMRTRDVKRGDVLESGAVVECVVELMVGAMSKAVRLGGALWTPWHPVKVGGQWVFACTVGEAGGEDGEKMCMVSSWYDLVVRGNPVVRVNGIETATMGHGMCGGVLAHPYFGTGAVVEALRKRTGYMEGHVRVRMEELETVRDEDGMVVSMF